MFLQEETQQSNGRFSVSIIIIPLLIPAEEAWIIHASVNAKNYSCALISHVHRGI